MNKPQSSYIAFLDMLGTRAAASLSDEEYTKAINDFNHSLSMCAKAYNGKVYGYSDNAYVQFDSPENLIYFFQSLRDILMNQHHYFCAAADMGTLSKDSEPFIQKDNFYSMKFTSDSAVVIYRMQTQYTGIGIFLSDAIVNNLQDEQLKCSFCKSICLLNNLVNGEFDYLAVYDIAYQSISVQKLNYLLSDYLVISATNPRAGRYYITPIISMIKSFSPDFFEVDSNLEQATELLSFKKIPKCFQTLSHNETYSLYFLFALIESVLSPLTPNSNSSIDATEICKAIISNFDIPHEKLISTLPTIPSPIISEKNKRHFLSILFNMKE